MVDLAQVLIDLLVLAHKFLNAVDPVVVHEDAVELAPRVLVPLLVLLLLNFRLLFKSLSDYEVLSDVARRISKLILGTRIRICVR